MNVVTSLRRRRLGLATNVDIDFTIDRLQLQEAHRLESELIDLGGQHGYGGPLACAKYNDTLAISSEDGSVNLLGMRNFKKITHWPAHANAIFDIKWKPNENKIVTAAGDCSLALWDAETEKPILKLHKVHQCSIKTISFYDTNVLASGSRDGSIRVHDLRSDEPTKIIIKDAHYNQLPGTSKRKKMDEKSNPLNGVTSVAFDTFVPRIYSSGPNDGTLKLWDLRQNKAIDPKHSADGLIQCYHPNHFIKHPKFVEGFYGGYSHLLFSSGKLYAACSDGVIYCYDRFNHPNPEPIRFTEFNSHSYARIAILDDKFLLSGSKLSGAKIWSLGNDRRRPHSSKHYSHLTRSPVGQLKPDNNDSNDTTCVETDWTSLSVFTCRDDHVVCKWTMQHVEEVQKEKLSVNPSLSSQESDVRIQMSDVVFVNVLQPNPQMTNRARKIDCGK